MFLFLVSLPRFAVFIFDSTDYVSFRAHVNIVCRIVSYRKPHKEGLLLPACRKWKGMNGREGRKKKGKEGKGEQGIKDGEEMVHHVRRKTAENPDLTNL